MKKRRIAIVSLLLCMMLAIVGGLVACAGGHTHTWGDWVLDQEPTLTETGHATRTCTECDKGFDEIVVSPLNDTAVWTYDEERSTPATHTQKGEGVFVSEDFGTVRIELDTVEHDWSEWTLDQEPTLTEKGHATRTCTTCEDGEDETEVPELTDTTVWTYDVEHSTPATHIQKGVGVYVSEDFGTVTAILDIVGEHEMTDWAWVDDEEPTETEGAKAERHCTIPDCEESEEEDVPELTDTSVWTLTETTVADYNHAGGRVYTSKYGTVLFKTGDKLVAPYDNQSYYAYDIEIADRDGVMRSNLYTYHWTNAMPVNANGVGAGNGGAFTSGNTFTFTMVNDVTGEVLIHEDKKSGESADYKGYADFDTHFVVLAQSGTNLSRAHFLTPYGEGGYYDISGSAWGTSPLSYVMACAFNYTDNDESKSINFIVVNDVVYFGVTFTSLSGDPINAENVRGSEQVLVKKGETLIGAYGWDGSTMRELDGLQGAWTGTVTGQGEAAVTLSGYGTFEGTLGGSTPIEGTYVLREDGKLDLYVSVGGQTLYFEVELELDGHTFTANPVQVTITFNMNGHGTAIDSVTVSKNLPYTLPEEPTEEGWLFRGWYLDADAQTPIELTEDGKFVPTDSVTLYVKWAKEITINVYVNGEEDGEPVQLKVGVGDNFLASLADFVDNIFNAETRSVFHGWYILVNGEPYHITDENAVYAEENDDVSVYGNWVYTPYIGTFSGANIHGKSNTTSSYSIEIKETGEISGSRSGTVVSYDEDSQILYWKNTSGVDNYFIFDAVNGIIIYNYSGSTNTYFENDIIFCVRDGYSAISHVSFKAPLPNGSETLQNNYPRLVQYTASNGDTVRVFLYYNRIYTNFTIKNTFDETLTVDTLLASSSVIVTNNATGQIILSRAAGTGKTFNDNVNTLPLDEYYGSYTGDGDNLELDGSGTLKWGDLNGTYTPAIDGSDYMFDVYITNAEGQREYYELTLDTDENTYTLHKRMVTVTLSVDGKDETVSAQSGEYNKNIQITLPTPTNEEYFFRGWFADAECTNELQKAGDNYVFTPTSDVTVYAKWARKVVITIKYNNDEADGSITDYGFGETLTVPRPSKAGSRFVGWFSDEECNTPWGTMDPATGVTTATLESGDSAPTAITIYAKWGDPPAYSGTYKLYYFDDGTSTGGVENPGTYSTNVTIDPEGRLPLTSGTAWPFTSYTMQVASYDEESGKLIFSYSTGTSTGTFTTYFDATDGFIALIARGNDFGDMFLLVPVALAEDATVTNSYWGKEGEIRVITLTKNNEKHNIFLHTSTAYFGVEFKDIDGEEVAAENAYQATTFYVYQNGVRIAGFGFNGTTMTAFDGYEGTYTYAGEDGNGIGTIKVNGTGLITVDDKQGNYTLVSGEDYTATLYFDDAFYFITFTINGGDYTYTLIKPMTTIIYNIDGHTTTNDFPASEQKNMNIQFTLPIPEVEGCVFRGWYTDENFYHVLSKDSEGNYIYTATTLETVTLYAKILEEVTLTIVYGEELGGTVEYKLAKGETMMEAGISAPPITNQKRFVQFYRLEEGEDEEPVKSKFETNYPVSANMTLYVEWEDVPEVDYVTSGSYKWTQEESGSWKSASGFSSTTSKLEIQFAVDGTFKFDWYVSSEGGNWDHLTITWIKADGSPQETLVNKQGGYNGNEKSGTLNLEVKAGDILRFEYAKDGSGNNGDDLARISNIEWTKKED